MAVSATVFNTLIVGLGRSGLELHHPVLTRARSAAASAHLFSPEPVLAYDPHAGGHSPADAVRVGSLAHAAELVDAGTTVVHVCTPPTARLELLEELGSLGFRKLIVEKPLALDASTLAGIVAARKRWGLDVAVVAPWLASTLTARIRELIDTRRLGRPREIDIVQLKPRFRRSLAGGGDHPSAFDVEVPHALAVALALVGRAHVVDAGTTDMSIDGVVVMRMGGARVTLDHDSGVRTHIRSDLTAMVRERRIAVRCDGGTIVGHYPASAADDAARLAIVTREHETCTVFRNDDLLSFVVGAYERFRTRVVFDVDLVGQAEVVRLLSDAKRISEQPCSLPRVAAALEQRAG